MKELAGVQGAGLSNNSLIMKRKCRIAEAIARRIEWSW
jgi:hypothetical protein